MLFLPRSLLLWALRTFFRTLPQDFHAVRLVPLEIILMDISHSYTTFPMFGGATGDVIAQAWMTGIVSSSGFIPSCGRGLVRPHCWAQAWLESFGFWGQLLSSCNTCTHSAGTCAAPSPSGHAWPEEHNRLQNLWCRGSRSKWIMHCLKMGTILQGCPGPCNDWCILL